MVLSIAGVTALLRLLPVYLLGRKGQTLPGPVRELARAMPPAIIALLVVYSLKSVKIGEVASVLPALAGVATAALLQYYKKNTLLSVGAATALYMVLIRVL